MCAARAKSSQSAKNRDFERKNTFPYYYAVTVLQDHVPVDQRSRGMWRAGGRGVARAGAFVYPPRSIRRKPFSTYSRKRGLDASHVMVLRSRQTSHCAARFSSAPKSASPPPLNPNRGGDQPSQHTEDEHCRLHVWKHQWSTRPLKRTHVPRYVEAATAPGRRKWGVLSHAKLS